MYRTLLALLLLTLLSCPAAASKRTIQDGTGRMVQVPTAPTRIICSGPGCLRLLTYLQGQNMVVAVDDMESGRSGFDARPYALANPQFKTLPIFGQFRGHDDPERILTLPEQPQVIFKTHPAMGHDPDELQNKTGIPVITLEYGNLGSQRNRLYQSIRTMGDVIGRRERAEAVIDFFETQIRELAMRSADIPEQDRASVFIGGVAAKGPHGFQSTEPGYPPFQFVHARNIAASGKESKELRHADVAKEKILEWDPEVLFLDLSTLQMGDGAGGLFELKTDPAYQALTAVQKGEVHGLLPYNWYSRNYGSILANGFFIGKQLSPERFSDIDPAAKANEIYEFLVGKPVFDAMNSMFRNLAFTRVPLN